MALTARDEQILGLLRTFRQVPVSELTGRLGVSTVTVRKDLSRLEALGLVVRFHGYARLADDTPVAGGPGKSREFTDAKRDIARTALQLIRPGDTICLDAGVTTAALADLLGDMDVRVVTNSLAVLDICRERRDINLTFIGGTLRQETGAMVGPLALDALAQIQFDIAFIGASGFTSDGIFLTGNSLEGQVKRRMLRAARRRVILAESRKLGRPGFSKFARTDLVDILITDSRAEDLSLEGEIEVLRADPALNL